MPESLNMMKVMAAVSSDGSRERYQLPCPALRDSRIRDHVTRMIEAGNDQLKFFPQDHFMEHKDLYLLEARERANVYSYMVSAEAAVQGSFSAFAVLPTAAAAVRAEYPDLPLLVKLNASVADPVDRRLVRTGTVQDALDVGADAVGLTVYYGSQYLAEATEHLVEVASECIDAGLPLIIWNYPRGKALNKVEESQVHAQFDGAAHILETIAGKVIPILKMKISEPYREEDWRKGVYAKTPLGAPKTPDDPLPPNVAKWMGMSRADLMRRLMDNIHRVYGVVTVMSGGEIQEVKKFKEDVSDGVGPDRHWGVIAGRSTWGQGTVKGMLEHANLMKELLPTVEIA
jgi:DhnA family fructose-bisphosphate aldolase class Ia